MIESYPLYWPEGWKRTKSAERAYGHFNRKERQYYSTGDGRQSSWLRSKDLSVSDALGRVLAELERMGIDRQDVIISTNVPTRLDGLPRSGAKEPDDPGAAVYWRKSHKSPMKCMAIDRYTKVADNLAALAATLEAMRAIERHGGAEILDRAFKGFAALPENASTPWRDVLGIAVYPVTEDQIESKFRELAKVHHPDVGGDAAQFRRIIDARNQALQEITA